MRPSILIFFALALVGLTAFLFVGGRGVVERSAATATTPVAPTVEIATEPISPPPVAQPARKRSPAASRQVAPDIVAPSGIEADELQWAAPREPLSQLSLALPPKPKPPKPLLFQPVAEAAGVIAAGGRIITIDGIAPLASDEMCAAPSGKNWPCGRAARTAFRAFLRGRAVTCDFPLGEVPQELAAPCRLGKQDAGAWLVGNGWARAADGGAYAEAEEAARAAKKGIFGSGPNLSGLKPVPDITASTPPVSPPAPAR